MKIFFLSYWFPYPPDNGSKIRVLNFIKALGERNEVHLLSLVTGEPDPRHVNVLRNYCRTVSTHPMPCDQSGLRAYAGLFSRRPRSVVSRFDPALYQSVQESIKHIKPDVIVVSMVDVAEYVLLEGRTIPSVLIDHNCEFFVIQRRGALAISPFTRLRYALTWRKYAAWEAKVCRQFDRVIMATEVDRRRMQEFCGLVDNIDVIPNAADTEHYDDSRWLPEAELLVYTGSLGYSANLDAVMYYKEEIMPLVRESYPNVQLLVTGRYGSAEVDGIGKCAGIRLTGYVDDIRDVLCRASACIVPLRQGGGMRLKIPEAMAAGVPVVATSVGVEGLSCTHGEHLLIGDTPEEFAAGIVRVLGDRTLAERLRENARRLVEERYSWRSSAGRFARLVESMVPQ